MYICLLWHGHLNVLVTTSQLRGYQGWLCRVQVQDSDPTQGSTCPGWLGEHFEPVFVRLVI